MSDTEPLIDEGFAAAWIAIEDQEQRPEPRDQRRPRNGPRLFDVVIAAIVIVIIWYLAS